MEVFVVWCARQFKREVIDDQQRHTHELLTLALVHSYGKVSPNHARSRRHPPVA
ncbi:hypothetical protein PAMC26577_14380 [Caballeronia sordidicola]|uniref:Uncharacterized protein n=1 Tax=Caballeronia sordidicola TaxID=196367 RepID=A0A242MUA2_CABSO|nr:hypothetical protein PAMC26577_14380 [Caballeronia sordidicola]